MPDPLPVGVVGLGARGFWLARMAHEGEATVLRAVADVNPRMLAIGRTLYPDIAFYDSGEALAADADIAAVLVGTGDRFHAGNAREALQHGKHALIEKPLAQSFEDLRTIAHLRRDTGLVVGTFLEMRHSGLWRRAKEVVDGGEVGTVLSAYLAEYVGRDRAQFFGRSKTRSRASVVSLVLQKGVHGLDLLNWLVAASPTRVSAVGGRRFFGGEEPADKHCRDCDRRETCVHALDGTYRVDPPGVDLDLCEDYCVWSQAADVEDVSLVNLEYSSGVVGSYHEVHFAPYYGMHLTLFGSAAQLDVEANHDTGAAWLEVTRRYGNRDQRRERPTRDTGHGGADPALLQDFAACCQAGREPLCDLRAGYESAAIGVATRISLDERRFVDIPRLEDL